MTLDGRPLQPRELAGAHGGRVHAVDSRRRPARRGVRRDRVGTGRAGRGRRAGAAHVPAAEPVLRVGPARGARGRRSSAVWAGKALLDGVSSWVGTRLVYVPGSSISNGRCGGDPACRQGRVPRRRAPHRRAAARAGGAGACRRGLCARAWADGLPRRRRGPRRRGPGRSSIPRCSRRASRMLRIAMGHDAAATAFLSSYGAEHRTRDDPRVRQLGRRAPRRRRRRARDAPLTRPLRETGVSRYALVAGRGTARFCCRLPDAMPFESRASTLACSVGPSDRDRLPPRPTVRIHPVRVARQLAPRCPTGPTLSEERRSGVRHAGTPQDHAKSAP